MAPIGTAAFAKAELKEWMKPVDVVVPKALRESGHTAKVYREPYGVTLVIGPFNGPLTPLFDPQNLGRNGLGECKAEVRLDRSNPAIALDLPSSVALEIAHECGFRM